MTLEPCLTDKEYANLRVELKGARLPPNMDVSPFEGKTVRKPYDNKIGLILFKDTNNFITLGASDINDRDALELSMEESISTGRLELGNRAGAAGGMVYPTTNSRSLSKVTKKRNSFLLANKKSSGLTCHYINNNNEIKSYNGVYNDILMRKLNSNQKKKLMLKYTYLRSITIKEMLKRIQTIVIVYQFGLFKNMNNNPFEVLNNIIQNGSNSTFFRTFTKMNYTKFESALLVWSCSTGESRNHRALTAHVDANKSNEIETLVLFGRVPHNTKKTYLKLKRNM